MTKSKEKESSDGLKDNSILGNGATAKSMEWDFGVLQMETAIWESGKTE